MRSLILVCLMLLFIVSMAPYSHAQITPAGLNSADSTTFSKPDDVTPGLYWFQVGAWAANGGGYGSNFGISVTGASVDIRVNYRHSFTDSNGDVAYWVGVNLPGDAFIQVGYMIRAEEGYPQWFWEYFPQGHASENDVGFLGQVGDDIGPNGTWYHFSLEASGTRWYAFVNSAPIGSVDMKVGDSGGNGPYAVAEVPEVRNARTLLGPAQFRNLQYRDTAGTWHMVPGAVSLCCFGSSTYSDIYTGAYPYGVEAVPDQNNYWIAGSNVAAPIQEQGDYLWPWYQVNVEGLPQGWTYRNGWYVYDSTVDLTNVPQVILAQDTSRYSLEGWYVNGQLENDAQGYFTVADNLMLKPNYVQQWLVQVNSKLGQPLGGGWYNDGATATVGVNPTFVPAPNFLGGGAFQVGSVFTGWEGSSIPVTNGQSRIEVTGPIVLTATWHTSYGLLPYYSLLVLAGVVGLGFYWRKLNRDSKSENAQPSEEPKSPASGLQVVSTASAPAKLFCIECGREIPLGSQYCNECGAKQT